MVASDDGYRLTVDVVGIESKAGFIRMCLIDDDSRKFLNTCDDFADRPIRGKLARATFYDLPPGKYCVYVYHDENSNHRLDIGGLFGKPTEPYGFSNDPSTLFGPPNFRKCLFELKGDHKITIKLK